MGSRLARRLFEVFEVFFFAVVEAEVEGAEDELLLACCGGAPATRDGARHSARKNAVVMAANMKDNERKELGLVRRISVLCRK